MTVEIDDDFGLMLNCAVRYACGRQSYMPSTVVRYITPLISQLSDRTLSCMERDVRENILMNNCGDPKIDLPIWVQFHENVKKELYNRGKEFWN